MSNNYSNGEKFMIGFLAAGGLLLLFIGLMAYNIFVGGFVLSKLWAWFVVPTFGLPPLSLLQAYGIWLVSSFLTHQHRWDKKLECEIKDDIGHNVGQMLGILSLPWVMLLLGYIVKCWM